MTIALCGAICVVLALTALLWPRGALAVVPDAETASECLIIRDQAARSKTASLTPEQMSALRAVLAETTLRWGGRRGSVILRETEEPLYQMFFGASKVFELTDTRAFFGNWRYRLTETDAQRIAGLLDSFFA